MAIDHDVDVIADRVTHCGDTGGGRLDRLHSFDWHRRRNRHRLKRGEPIGDRLRGQVGELFGVVDGSVIEMVEVAATQMTVQPHVITHGAAP